MAVSAKFEADYSQFVSATKGADNALAAMMNRANTTQGALQGMMSGVPTGMSAVTSSVKTSEGALGKMAGAATSVAGALGAAFTVGAVIKFGSALLNTADNIVRTADRTGLLTSEVQKLSFITSQSGNDIDEMTGAIGQMQNRLSSGEDSAISAVGRLGLTMKQLEDAGPYEQVRLLSGAFGKIEGPAKAAELAMDLFGKTGIAILPTLRSEFDNLANSAPVMSDNTVRALENAGDQLEKFQLQVKVFAAESYNMLGKAFDFIVIKVYEFLAGMQDATAGVLRMIEKLPGGAKALELLGASVDTATQSAQWYRDAAAAMERQTNDTSAAVAKGPASFEKFGKSAKATAEEAKKHAAEIKKLAAEHKAFQEAVDRASYPLTRLNLLVGGNSQAIGEINPKYLTLISSVGDLSHKFTNDLAPALITAGGNMAATAVEVQSLGDKITSHLQDALGRIPQMFINAFTGGGGVIGALKAIGIDLLNAIIREILNPIMGVVASWAVKIGRMIAGAFSGSGGMVGSFAGMTPGVIGGTTAGTTGGGLSTALVGALPIAGALALALPTIIGGFTNQYDTHHVEGGGGLSIHDNIIAHNQLTYDQQMQQYANNNRDLYERQVADGEMPPGYRTGTQGRNVDFGQAGTTVRLHGRERVSTEHERTELGELRDKMAEFSAGLASIERTILFRQPQLIAKAVAIALAKSGARA